MIKSRLLAGTAVAMLGMSGAFAAAASPGVRTSAMAAQAAASPDSPELAAFKKAIRARYAIKEKAFADHDAETIVMQFYTADVISVGEGEGVFIGRDQIRPLYQEVVKDNKVEVDSVYSYVSGNAGWDWTDFNVREDQALHLRHFVPLVEDRRRLDVQGRFLRSRQLPNWKACAY